MNIIEELATKALNDDYFKELFLKAEIKSAHNFFQVPMAELKDKEYTDILRFADILSRSIDSNAKNKAYKIVSLLVEDFKDDPIFIAFSNSILLKLGNFPALSFLEKSNSNNDLNKYSSEILFERAIKETFQRIPNSDFVFTDSQYQIFEELKNNNHFSFSGPTSLGKSFIIKAFVRFLISEHKSTDNIIILVPTRALINQTVLYLKEEFKDVENYRVLAHPLVPVFYRQEKSRFIFVFTPERLLAYLSEPKNPKIDYLFVDEAQKIISEKDTRSPLYYYSILQAERKSIKLFFASPNIPNPEIFLQLFEKNTDEKLSIKNSPVSQNRYFLDFTEKRCLLLSESNTEEIIPIKFENTDFFQSLKFLTGEQKSIVYCNTKEDTINFALKFASTLPDKNNERINEVVDLIKDYLHKQYFLIDCLKKGVAFHFGSLPQRIREKVEKLFEDREIDYVFCTSTLLEGVNLPAKNIFILSNAIGLTKFSDIEFWNLAGRAGRLTKELSGNIICTRIENKKNRWDKPETDLLIVKEKAIKEIIPLVISGRQNFFDNIGASLSGEKFTKGKPSSNEISVWNQYANIALIHELRSDDSVLRSNFISKNDKAKKLLQEEKKKNAVPEKILAVSPMIKAKYQNGIFNLNNLADEILPNEIDYQTVLDRLRKLSIYYRWDIEESGGRNPMYKTENSLKYYATIMNNWLNSTPLNLMITNAISFYSTQGFYYVQNQQQPFIASNPHHINFVINELITNIDNILRFKFKNYFENFYLLLEKKLGGKNVGVNWAEYLEYGTTDYQVIELQNIGIPRHLAMFILKNYSDCLTFEERYLIAFNHNKLLDSIDKKSAEFKELKDIFANERD